MPDADLQDQLVGLDQAFEPPVGRTTEPVRRRRQGTAAQVQLVVLSIALLVVAWELVIVVFGVKAYTLPTPVSVATTLGQSANILMSALLTTVKEAVMGFLIATGVGVALALGIAESKVVERMVYPLLVISNAVPKIALAPVLIAWFGLGSLPRVLMGSLLAVFPIVISTAVGLVGVDNGLILLGRSTDASRWRVFRLIRLPAALPSILGGLKVGITLSLTGAVVGEFVGGSTGLGYVITQAQGNLRLSLAFAAIVVLAVAGVALFYLIELIEKLLDHGR